MGRPATPPAPPPPVPAYRFRRAVAGVLLGATLWGLSGTAAQQLMQVHGVTAGWLVAVRMLASGLLLLGGWSWRERRGAATAAAARIPAPGGGTARGLARRSYPRGSTSGSWPRHGPPAGLMALGLMALWRDPPSRRRLLVFALGGLLGVQYSYMASIALGNAATATFLQYLGPAFVTLYEVLRWRRRPRPREWLALLLAVAGTLLLATGGALNRLSVPAGAVAWGLVSAATLAFYTLSGAALLRRWPAPLVLGWAMLLGGTGMSLAAPPWRPGHARWDGAAGLLLAFVVLGGTLLAFTLYLSSLRHLQPSQTSLLACMEPLAAAASAALLLGVPFTAPMAAGGACVLATVALLAGAGDAPPTRGETRRRCGEAEGRVTPSPAPPGPRRPVPPGNGPSATRP